MVLSLRVVRGMKVGLDAKTREPRTPMKRAAEKVAHYGVELAHINRGE
jgi:hypothetical protein